MSADEMLREGKLDNALAELQRQVRDEPANAKHRVFLFQLLAVLGQWERSLTQLNVAGELDAGALAMVQVYREAVRCEVLRAAVFAGERTPVLFGDPESWQALLVEALRLTARGQHAQARPLREQAFEAAPTTSGTIDGNAFAWIADADMRLGPILEGIVNGKYYWVPFHRIRSLQIDAPADLRDLVWMPAHFTLVNGGEAAGLIPTRYPGSEQADDAQIRLARRTEWSEDGAGMYLGMGQRVLATDAGEYSLMDARRIDLSAAGG